MQEKKAANALEALKNMTAPTARVLREGEESVVPASELVPGDIIYLEDGAIVPADIRIIEDNNMKVQEAALTGESVPSEKDGPTVLPADAPLGDRVNMAYSSSIVMYGNATGIVVGTGMNTEVGKIANLLDEQDDFDTPIKRKLNSVGKMLSLVGLIVCVLVLGISLIRDWTQWVPMVMTAISLAISIIPEGLPATSTIIMALGVQRMAKKNALVKSLPAVETLGSASVICCDKTGTLTLNKMTVTCVAVGDDFAKGQETPVARPARNVRGGGVRRPVGWLRAVRERQARPRHPGQYSGRPDGGGAGALRAVARHRPRRIRREARTAVRTALRLRPQAHERDQRHGRQEHGVHQGRRGRDAAAVHAHPHGGGRARHHRRGQGAGARARREDE